MRRLLSRDYLEWAPHCGRAGSGTAARLGLRLIAMLERVAHGQSRFMTPGVAPDTRGVLLGRYGMLLFPTLEGVVSWLRVYSAESSLDELLPALEIHQVRTQLMSRELLVRIPATSSYAMDRAARCAKLVGGSLFTGTTKHFVKYRDDRSPYGYDASDIAALPKGADIVLYGTDFTQIHTKEGQLGFEKLLFRLSLRRIPGGRKLRAEERADLVLTVARGLANGVIRYLWRNRVQADLGLVRPRGDTAFATSGSDPSYLLVRARTLPERILDLFSATPGIDIFRWVAPQAAVQVGFAHAIDLSACASVFAADRVYLFWGESAQEGRSDRVDVLDGQLELSGIEHFTRVRLRTREPRAAGTVVSTFTPASDPDADISEADTLEVDSPAADPKRPRRPSHLADNGAGNDDGPQVVPAAAQAGIEIGIPIRLAPSVAPPRHVIATLIPLNQSYMLKRLVYVLPETSLRGYRIAMSDRGILVIGSDNIDIIPLGQLLCELSPGLMIPLGMELVPRVAPDALAQALGHKPGNLTVFARDDKPFRLLESALEPLERRALAKHHIDSAVTVDNHLEPPQAPAVVNDPVGRFALWGFPAPTKR